MLRYKLMGRYNHHGGSFLHGYSGSLSLLVSRYRSRGLIRNRCCIVCWFPYRLQDHQSLRGGYSSCRLVMSVMCLLVDRSLSLVCRSLFGSWLEYLSAYDLKYPTQDLVRYRWFCFWCLSSCLLSYLMKPRYGSAHFRHL